MAKNYDKYYKKYSPFFPLRLLVASVTSRSQIQRHSIINRQKDYVGLGNNPGLLKLHRQINDHLFKAAAEWESHDYGEGYFYQGFPGIGVSGLRDTKGRVEAMGLQDIVKGKSVLEIGCNTGFVALSIAESAKSVAGFDINPYIVDIAKSAARYLEIANTTFSVSSFEDFGIERSFDVVLSFANHSTYDGNTKQSIEEYFRRCKDSLNPGGKLLFESHPPELEGDGLKKVLALIEREFVVDRTEVLDYGSFLDKNRTFVVATRGE